MRTRKTELKSSQKFINPHRLFHGVWLPQWLESRPEVSEKAKKLYAHLTYFAGGKGCAWPTFNTLAEKLHVSRRHLIRLVKELTRHGLISVMNVNRPGKGSCANFYRFLWHPWMQPEHDASIYTGDYEKMLAVEEPENPDCLSGTRIIPRSDKTVTPWGDMGVTPPSDIRVTPRVTPMSPKENKKKRLIKKYPKGASYNSVPLQATVSGSDQRRPTANFGERIESSSGYPSPSPASDRGESVRLEAFFGAEDKSRTNGALTRKGWSIARRLVGEFWETCKVKPDLRLLSGYSIRLLQSGFREIDIVSAFERALHQCHSHATDVGEVWEASSTVHRAEVLLKRCRERWKPLTADERAELRVQIESSLVGISVEKEPGGLAIHPQSASSVLDPVPTAPPTPSLNPSRKKENEPVPIPPEQWPTPMQVRATFNALRRAAGLPTRPEMP